MTTAGTYPVRVDASLDASLSRWLWLVKWLLLIPHYVVLALLWVAFVVLSAIAFFAILFTGSYPRSIFEFNVGVLRWTWRVQFYAVGAFGTDKYPPFSLAADPAYPAHLEVEYPSHLSRGLVLVKWWLLAIPHYIIVAIFTGGGLWAGLQANNDNASWNWPGLISILAIIAAIVVAFTGRYPRQIFDFVLGLDRWTLRVAAYAGLMTDSYPPFRLDMGGDDPGTVTMRRSPAPGQDSGTGQPGTPPGTPPSGPGGPRAGWTAARIVAVVAGSVLTLISLGMLAAGGAALWAETAARQGGYVDLGTRTYVTGGHAIASKSISLDSGAGGWDAAGSLFGTVRLHATSTTGQPAFIGIAPAAAASQYLAGVGYATVHGNPDTAAGYTEHAGGAPSIRPARVLIWDAFAVGPGPQALTWPVRGGDWMVVAMNANGSAPVSMTVSASATLPALPWIAGGLLGGGVIALAGGITLLVIPVRRASRRAGAASG